MTIDVTKPLEVYHQGRILAAQYVGEWTTATGEQRIVVVTLVAHGTPGNLLLAFSAKGNCIGPDGRADSTIVLCNRPRPLTITADNADERKDRALSAAGTRFEALLNELLYG